MSIQSDKQHLILNQNSLQDFLECQRRFQLRYIDKISWPAAQTDSFNEFESAAELGNQFHHLCQQYFSGVPPSLLENSITDEILQSMWHKFLPYGTELRQFSYYSEQLLSSVLLGQRLIAKYDLLVKYDDFRYVIIDWKTAPHKPRYDLLENRVQTYLYPFIFCQAGSDLFGLEEIQPDMITMQYWYPLINEPQIIFPYSSEIHSRITSDLKQIISEIQHAANSQKDLSLTDNQSHCKYCVFRPLCDRGLTPGKYENFLYTHQEDLSNEMFDFGQVTEIEF